MLAGIAIGGLALTHYRVFIFAGAFVLAFTLLNARKDLARALLTTLLWLGVGSGVLFLPWFLRIFSGRIPLIFAGQITTPAGDVPLWSQQYNSSGDLSNYLPALVWMLLLLSVSWGLWQRHRNVVLISLWWLLLLLAANPQWLNLPGLGSLSNLAVFLAAYIPASVLIGGAMGGVLTTGGITPEPHGIIQTGSGVRRLALSALLCLLLIAVGAWGAVRRLSDLRPAQYSLVTSPDLRAIAWIQGNTPPEARFLVNSFLAYGGNIVVGSDAGWWLPLLARRQTMLPPITYGFEQGPRQDYREWVNALPIAIHARGPGDPEVWRLLSERGVSHVYLGQRQGRVNYDGSVLEAEQLLSSPHFRLLYHEDRVWVFEICNSATTCAG